MNQRQTLLKLQLWALPTPHSVPSNHGTIHRYDYSVITLLVFATGRFIELNRWKRGLSSIASDLEMVSCAM